MTAAFTKRGLLDAPKYDDPVTVLVDGLLVHSHWTGQSKSTRSFGGNSEDLFVIRRCGIAGMMHDSWIALSDEGKTWVRGHVTEKDSAGAALLTVHALKRGSQ